MINQQLSKILPLQRGGGTSGAGYKVTFPAMATNWDEVNLFLVLCADGSIVNGTNYFSISGKTIENVVALKCLTKGSTYYMLKLTLTNGIVANYNTASISVDTTQYSITKGPNVTPTPFGSSSSYGWLFFADTTISAIEMYDTD